MGGIDRVVDLAQQAFDSGDYRWAATLLDHAMFTDGEHAGARELYADTLEQLAYGAENATWRNFFLSGATELRDGNFGTAGQVTSPTMLAQLTPEQIFDGLAIRVNGPRSWGLDITVDVTLADTAVNHRLALRNGVLVQRKVPADPATATVTVRLANKIRLLALAAGTSPRRVWSSPAIGVRCRRWWERSTRRTRTSTSSRRSAAAHATSITTLPSTLRSATCRNAAAVRSSGNRAPMYGRTVPAANICDNSVRSRTASSGRSVMKVRISMPRTQMSLSKTRLSGMAGMVPDA